MVQSSPSLALLQSAHSAELRPGAAQASWHHASLSYRGARPGLTDTVLRQREGSRGDSGLDACLLMDFISKKP